MNSSSYKIFLQSSSSKLRIIGLVMIVASFAVFVYLTKTQNESLGDKSVQLVEKDLAITQQKVELAEKDNTLSKVGAENERRDALFLLASSYMALREKHDADALDSLYADRLDYYFINIKNAPKEVVRRSDKQYWSKYKDDKFILDGEPEILITSSSAKAMVKGKQCTTRDRCIEEIIEIVFSVENKVRAVRAFYAPVSGRRPSFKGGLSIL